MPEETLLNHLKLENIIHDSKMEKSVFILGERHGNENEYECYFNLIEQFDPFYLLCEICDKSDSIIGHRNPKINNWIKEHQNKVIICDLPDKEEEIKKN